MEQTPFDRQPTLVGTLLRLRPLRADDWNGLYAVAADPLLWEQHPSRDRYKEEVFRKFFDDALASGGALAAIDNATGDIIGSSRFHGYDAAVRTTEIGWSFVARHLWGRGYNPEMKRLMLAHAFRWVDRVYFVIGRDNWRSRHAIQRIGATFLDKVPGSTNDPSVRYVIRRQTE